MTVFTFLLSLSAVLFVLLLYFWSAYNSFVKKHNQVLTDFSDIDIQIKRRASLIQNLADIVKAYAKHEKGTFEEVAKARSAADTSSSAKESAEANNMLSQTLKSLFAVVENYPKLQANENFQDLQNQLRGTEDLIAEYREEYNKTVLNYNTSIQTFPNLFAASLFNFKPAQLFAAADSADNKVEI